MQVFCCPPLPVLVLWAGRGPPATARSLLTTPLGSRRLSLSCLGLESARKRSRTKVVTVAAAAAVGPRQVPSWDFPLSPSSPASVSPPPPPARPKPARPQRGGGPVAQWVSGAGRCPGLQQLPSPSQPWAPHQVRREAMWAGLRSAHLPCRGLLRVQVQVQGSGLARDLSSAPREIIALSLSPAVAQVGIWILTCKEPLLAGGAGGRATAILPNSGCEGKGAQFLPPHSHLSLLPPQTPPTGPRAGGPCIQWKVRLPTPSPAN